MIYSIIRYLPNNELCTQICKKEELNSELQCWNLDHLQAHHEIMIFVMSDMNSKGNTTSVDFVNNIYQDDDLLQMIRDNQKSLDQTEIFKIFHDRYNVPIILLPNILHEVKYNLIGINFF